MLIRVTYNCAPEELRGAELERFASAFREEVRKLEKYRTVTIKVCQNRGASRVVSYAAAGTIFFPEAELQQEFKNIARTALSTLHGEPPYATTDYFSGH